MNYLALGKAVFTLCVGGAIVWALSLGLMWWVDYALSHDYTTFQFMSPMVLVYLVVCLYALYKGYSKGEST